ncbi:aminotransferase class I/II-fold pyridoxal phosphate-dependent enzyme [Aureivirga sp. CE67]|uniref:aminotransferase class I/II-fold pyridoxal phosphate-dependent enzyme n=1 Tax=Aureivirga sp. CE67 TaxID=1788983 RepID=UPI0018CB3C59|nr:aminotransferase class I/II-fold pyridoxal phosphate-dependent enzyme [Aureivirga sp. CE67]
MSTKSANSIQDLQFFGEFGGVNPSISDSATFTFMAAKTMQDTFEGETEGCYLYSRHTSPSNLYLSQALAAMEGTESANVASSGMGAITSTIMQLCKTGDHIVSSRTIYGGTYAFMKNFLPRLDIQTSFVDITDLESVENSINENTKVIYCETVSNPLLEIADISELSKIAKRHNLPLVVDNTFSPLIVNPQDLGATITIHSLTKFINGTNDAVGGVVCASNDFINSLKDVNDGAAMLYGPVMDSLRASSILKNMRTLPIRIKQHSRNALFLAENFEKDGLKVVYPGLKSHKDHELYNSMRNEEFGFGGLLTIDVGSLEKANQLMELMQDRNLGYLAVSLGFYKTLFSAPGSSTSSEIPEEEQNKMGLSDGIIRFSIGLDHDIERTYNEMKKCMEELEILSATVC